MISRSFKTSRCPTILGIYILSETVRIFERILRVESAPLRRIDFDFRCTTRGKRISAPPVNGPLPKAEVGRREVLPVQGGCVQPESHRIDLANSESTIHILDWGGEGPLALLHHANGFCAATWSLVAQSLTSRWRVLAIDARGHGDSSRPAGDAAYDWHEFKRDWLAVSEWALDRIGGSAIDLVVGNSFGGAVALLAAAERPELYRRLVLLDPVVVPARADENADGSSVAGPLRKSAEASPSPIALQARRRRQVWPTRTAAAEAWRDKPMFAGWEPRAFELYLEHGLRDREDGHVELACSGDVEAAIFEHTGCADVLGAARSVTAPTWVVRAAKGYFPTPMFEALCEQLEFGQFLELDAGHLMPMEAPELVADLLLSQVWDENPAGR